MTASATNDIVRVEHMAMSFGGTQALRDVSFSIQRGTVHALLGGNGSGKSTLIKTLAGIQRANAGWIEVAGGGVAARHVTPGWSYGAGLRFVHQAVGTFAEFSVAENFALGSTYGSASVSQVRWDTLNRRVRKTLDRFGLDVSPSDRMGDLRPAQQTLVAIARALEDEANSAVLFLDEPTATLPAHEVDLVHQAIRGYTRLGHTVVIVSHRVDEVLAVADNATFLRDGQHIGTRPVAGMDERALVQQIAGIDGVATSTSGRVPSTEVTLQVDHLAVGSVSDVSFRLHRGEILGLSGLAGSGRSSLLRTICGLRPRRSGSIVFEGREIEVGLRPPEAIRRGIAYIPEDRGNDAMFSDRSIRENLSAPALARFTEMGRIIKSRERRKAQDSVGRYGIVAASAEAPISTLSGGNQQKVILARWLELEPKLLLLDEPTQGVDVGARSELHNLIRQAAAGGTSIILCSSDARELSDLSDRVIGLSVGRISGELSREQLDPQRCVELAYGLAQSA